MVSVPRRYPPSVPSLRSTRRIEALAAAMIAIAAEAERDPEMLHGAPWSAPIGRLDEATAARRPVLRWQLVGTDGL